MAPLLRSRSLALTSKLLLICLLLFFIYWTTLQRRHTGDALPQEEILTDKLPLQRPRTPPKPECPDLPVADRLLVTVKTGGTQAIDSLPIQLLTSLKCVKNLLVVSDLEQDIGTVHLHDVLTNVDKSIRDSHPDFSLYHKLQKLGDEKLLDQQLHLY